MSCSCAYHLVASVEVADVDGVGDRHGGRELECICSLYSGDLYVGGDAAQKPWNGDVSVD